LFISRKGYSAAPYLIAVKRVEWLPHFTRYRLASTALQKIHGFRRLLIRGYYLKGKFNVKKIFNLDISLVIKNKISKKFGAVLINSNPNQLIIPILPC
jgi:hypothetical protein